MSPEEIVRAEMAAWGRNDVDEVMSYFSENVTLHAGPYAPVSGHEAMRKTVEGYSAAAPALTTRSFISQRQAMSC